MRTSPAGHRLRYKARAQEGPGCGRCDFHDLCRTFGSHAIRMADSREARRISEAF